MNNDLSQFYELLSVLEKQRSQGRNLGEYTGRSRWPARGVYFFREPGEYRSSQPNVPRVVRVGTHAVSANSKSTLWNRLRAHRGNRDGGGNHRGSVFRLHIGAALLVRDRATVGELPTWAEGASAPRATRATEVAHECRVSAYIGSMSVLWVDVPDEPGPKSARAFIERNAIALLSNQLKPHDPPSVDWLGLHNPRVDIRRSGLWNLNHVHERYESAFLDILAQAISATVIP